jgi:hypothetical protein
MFCVRADFPSPRNLRVILYVSTQQINCRRRMRWWVRTVCSGCGFDARISLRCHTRHQDVLVLTVDNTYLPLVVQVYTGDRINTIYRAFEKNRVLHICQWQFVHGFFCSRFTLGQIVPYQILNVVIKKGFLKPLLWFSFFEYNRSVEAWRPDWAQC